jgi:hypothetical protein
MEDALKASTHPHDFKLLVSSGGQRSTSVEQAIEEPAPAAPAPPAPAAANGAPNPVGPPA